MDLQNPSLSVDIPTPPRPAGEFDPVLSSYIYCGHRICVVDDAKIRDRLEPDEAFDEFATNAEFPDLIPKGDIWVAKRIADTHSTFFLTHALVQMHYMASGYSEEDAYEKGLQAQASEREKVRGLPQFNGDPITVADAGKISDQMGGSLHIKIVSGALVRNWFKTDFSQGGHDIVYPWIPHGEVWVEANLPDDEKYFTLLHEITERRLMLSEHLSYDAAHDAASEAEYAARHIWMKQLGWDCGYVQKSLLETDKVIESNDTIPNIELSLPDEESLTPAWVKRFNFPQVGLVQADEDLDPDLVYATDAGEYAMLLNSDMFKDDPKGAEAKAEEFNQLLSADGNPYRVYWNGIWDIMPLSREAISADAQQWTENGVGIYRSFDESKHPRGQPENAGQFGPGGGQTEESTKQKNPQGEKKKEKKEKKEKKKPEKKEEGTTKSTEKRPASETKKMLRFDRIVDSKPLSGGKNAAALVEMDGGAIGVYKSTYDEADSLIAARHGDVQTGTFYRREIASYSVAEIMGLDLVPVTVQYQDDYASVQEYVSDCVEAAVIADNELRYDGDEQLAQAAIFDYITGAMDRHSGNWLVDMKNNKLVLIDNGLSFPNTHHATYGINAKIMEHAIIRDLDIPDAEKWKESWPKIEKALHKADIENRAIELTRQRFEAVVDISTRMKELGEPAKISQLPGFDLHDTLSDYIKEVNIDKLKHRVLTEEPLGSGGWNVAPTNRDERGNQTGEEGEIGR